MMLCRVHELRAGGGSTLDSRSILAVATQGGSAVDELPVLDNEVEAADHCRCEGGQPKNFARACLLLLAEAP